MKLFNGAFTRMAEAQVDWSTRSYHPGDPALARLLGIGVETAAGVQVTPDNARTCPEVDACVGLIENTIGTVPLDLFERVDQDTRNRVNDHPLHQLLHDAPNENQTSAEFRLMMEGWRVTHGNAYARIFWGAGGVPRELVPLHPNACRGYRLLDGSVVYRYTPPLGGGMQTLMASEVLHLRDMPYSRDMVNGESRVLRHKEAIGRAMATGEYMSRFFSNNAVPKAFLKPSQKLDEDQTKLLREQFERRHGGLENAFRVGVLPASMEVLKLGIDNDSAQMIEAYTASVAQLARIWGIPLHLIGELSKDTSWGTGIEQQSIGFIVYFMRPKFVVWEQALNRALMSSAMRQRFYFEFNADGMLRGDFKTRMEGFALMVQWGLASINEIRRLMNLPAVDGGDSRLQPLNMAPADKIMEVLMRGNSSPNEGAPNGA